MELLIPVPLLSPGSQQQLCDLIYSGHFVFMDSHNGGLFVWLLSLRRIFLAGLLKKAKRQRQPECPSTDKPAGVHPYDGSAVES